jgi:hypothetical protein
MNILQEMRQREFWTSFDARREVARHYGDRSKTTTVRLIGFFRAIEFSWQRPWYPRG